MKFVLSLICLCEVKKGDYVKNKDGDFVLVTNVNTVDKYTTITTTSIIQQASSYCKISTMVSQ